MQLDLLMFFWMRLPCWPMLFTFMNMQLNICTRQQRDAVLQACGVCAGCCFLSKYWCMKFQLRCQDYRLKRCLGKESKAWAVATGTIRAADMVSKHRLSFLNIEMCLPSDASQRKKDVAEKCSVMWWKLGSLLCCCISVTQFPALRTRHHGNHYVGQLAMEHFRNLLGIY